MVERTNRTTQQTFWGCPDWPRCTTRPAPPADPATTIRNLTRQRDRLQAGYDQLLAEVRQLRKVKALPSRTLERELTRLITLCHPDKWQGEGALAHLLTTELLTLRDRLKEGHV